jgi:hypothetical protein
MYFFSSDVNGDDITYKTNQLMDGRKCISYEPTTVGMFKFFELVDECITLIILGPIEIHILKENEPVDGSPLIVHAFDPFGVHIINFPKKIQINTINHFLIDPTKAGKGSLKISIKGSIT